jgi:sulfite exporter TauE/SafE
MCLGAIAGSLGAAFAMLVRGWQGVFSIVLGMAAILLGLGLLGLLPIWPGRVAVAPLRRVGGWMKNRMMSKHPAAPFALGLANGLLPCGAVFAMLSLAALSGTPWQGISLMFIFGLGTLPAMLGFAFATACLGLRLRQHLYRMAASLVVLVGLQLTLRGLALHGQIPHLHIGDVMLW